MTRLSEKQETLLLILGAYGEPDWKPQTTFEIFNMAQSLGEAMAADAPAERWSWYGWDREAIYTTMRRLENRGLVRKQPPTERVSHPLEVGRCWQAPRQGRAQYEWTLTNQGLRAVQERA